MRSLQVQDWNCFSYLQFLWTQLSDAARAGRTDNMLELIEEGADIEFKDDVRDMNRWLSRVSVRFHVCGFIG